MRIKIAFYYSSTYKRESSFGQNSQNDARCRKDSRGLQLYSINTFDKLTSGRQRLPLIPRGSSEFQNKQNYSLIPGGRHIYLFHKKDVREYFWSFLGQNTPLCVVRVSSETRFPRFNFDESYPSFWICLPVPCITRLRTSKRFLQLSSVGSLCLLSVLF